LPRDTSNPEKSDELVHCSVKNAAVLCENQKDFGRLVTFWFGTFAMLFSATGCVARHQR